MDFRPFVVREIVQESECVRTFELERRGQAPPSFEPGQFFLLRLDGGAGKRMFRPYSAASADGERLRFCVKRNGTFTSLLWKLSAGDEIEVGGPYGAFMLQGGDSGRVLLAGGTGIAPMRSMAYRTIKEGKKCALFHSAKSMGELTYLEEMASLAAKGNGFSYFPSITREAPECWKGGKERITAQTIRQALGGFDGSTFYICGPKGMVSSVAESLLAEGVAKEKIRREEWG
jgi:ferredoxin-NADP reductase